MLELVKILAARLLALQGGNGGVVGFCFVLFFSFPPTGFGFLAGSQVSGNLCGKLTVYAVSVFNRAKRSPSPLTS